MYLPVSKSPPLLACPKSESYWRPGLAKQILAGGVALLAMALTLAACGGGDESSGAPGQGGGGTPSEAANPGELRVVVDGQTFSAPAAPDACTVTGDTFFVFAREGDLTISAQGSAQGGNVTIMRANNQLYTTPGTDGNLRLSGKSFTYTSNFVKGSDNQPAGSGTATATCR